MEETWNVSHCQADDDRHRLFDRHALHTWPAGRAGRKAPAHFDADGLRHRLFRVQHRGCRRQVAQGQERVRRPRAPGRQRRGAAEPAEGRSGPGLGHGYRRLFRAGERVRVRGQGLGTTAAATHSVRHGLQFHLARRRQGHGCQGGQGPQGQARRDGGGLSRPQSERLGGAGLRRPDPQRREAGRVLQLRRHVEGDAQQRDRRRHGLEHLGPGQGGRDLAARHHLSRRHHGPTRRDGRGCTRSAPTSSRTR